MLIWELSSMQKKNPLFFRTADDADMNDQLKAEDRAEDPMLAYVKQKRAKKVATDTNIESKLIKQFI